MSAAIIIIFRLRLFDFMEAIYMDKINLQSLIYLNLLMIFLNMLIKMIMLIITVNFSKAFDKLSHDKLLHELLLL